MPCNLKKIEYQIAHGGIYVEDKVAMFNSTFISAEEVRKFIEDELIDFEYHPGIVTMTKEQYENLKDIVEPNIDKEKDFYEDLILEQQGGII